MRCPAEQIDCQFCDATNWPEDTHCWQCKKQIKTDAELEQIKQMDEHFKKEGEEFEIDNLLEDCIKKLYIPYNKLGFEFKCKIHNHLNNKDDMMKLHLLEDHSINIPFTNWQSIFTTFSIGDSYSNSYRCRICRTEFLFEKDAKAHIIRHGIKTEKYLATKQ